MTDSTLNRFLASGTNAERLAFTPDPATPASGPDPTYIWFETDTGDTYAWDFGGAAWVLISASGGGITQLTGDITAGPGSGSQAATIANDAVTFAKMQNASAGSRVIGSTAAGNFSELTIGPGLKLVGSILVPTVIGCRATMAADQTTANYTTSTAVPFDGADEFDTDNFHNPASQNTRIVIPDLTATYGVRAKKVSLTGTLSVALLTADMWMFVNILKNGAIFNPGARMATETGITNPGVTLTVNDVVVVGDGTEYFELTLQVETDTSITVSANRTSLSVKVTDWG